MRLFNARLHATFQCPFVATIITEICLAFFPSLKNHFHLRDIILATITDKHSLYEGKSGQQIASIIWDTFLAYVMKCRSKNKTPIPTVCIHKIKSQLNRILKILPKSLVALHINSRPQLLALISND